jgi:hypothetical protein
VVSLLLFVHLTGLAIAVLANVAPVSELRGQLGMVPIVRQYYQLLHLFLGYDFHLTDDAPLDSDLRIEVETNWSGASRADAKKLTLPEPGLGHGMRAQLYRRLVGTTGSLVDELTDRDTESVEGLLPRAIAAKLLAEAGIDSGKHRVRFQRNQSLDREEVTSSDPNLRNPLAPARFSTLYEADVTFSGGELVLTKAASALETSPVNRRAR